MKQTKYTKLNSVNAMSKEQLISSYQIACMRLGMRIVKYERFKKARVPECMLNLQKSMVDESLNIAMRYVEQIEKFEE